MLPCGIPLITFIHDENLLLILTLIFLLNRKGKTISVTGIFGNFLVGRGNFSVSKTGIPGRLALYLLNNDMGTKALSLRP